MWGNQIPRFDKLNKAEFLLRRSPGLIQRMLFRCHKFFNFDKSNTYVITLASLYFTMAEEFSRSIELTHVLNVPPDFQIELMFINLHIWFLLNRLGELEQSAFITAFKKYLTNFLDKHVDDNIMRLHINRKNEFVLDTKHYLENCQRFLSYHFRGNPQTLSEPAYKLDALVWTLVFFEKVDRYDERVYLTASYILETHRYFQSLTLEDFKDFNVNFNVFRVPIDYRRALERVNPPLSPAEFEAEKRKPDTVKKSFRYDYKDESVVLPIDEKVRNAFRLRNTKLGRKVGYNARKFFTLDTYDFYSQREETESQQQAKRNRYIWNVGLAGNTKKDLALLSQGQLTRFRERINKL